MRVGVQLFATFATFLPSPSQSETTTLDVSEDSTVADLAALLGIPDDLQRVVLVNGAEAESGCRLGPGDVVTFFPPLAGGARP